MSQIRVVFVGPYAEWHLTAKQDKLPDDLYSLLLESESGVGLTFHHGPPNITIKGKRYIQKFWTPFYYRDAKEQPPRCFEWGDMGELGAADLQGVDAQAEIQWFRETFKEQLKALSDHYGKRPKLCWGVVSSCG